uniref:Uncharacterized protein n=1 Tax=Oryza glumipatula TaxID=40148 RepID=A0A0E0A9G5_9ORYZ
MILDYLVNDSSVAVKIVWFLPLWHQLLLQKLRVTHLLACRLDKGLLPPQQSWFGPSQYRGSINTALSQCDQVISMTKTIAKYPGCYINRSNLSHRNFHWRSRDNSTRSLVLEPVNQSNLSHRNFHWRSRDNSTRSLVLEPVNRSNLSHRNFYWRSRDNSTRWFSNQ